LRKGINLRRVCRLNFMMGIVCGNRMFGP